MQKLKVVVVVLVVLTMVISERVTAQDPEINLNTATTAGIDLTDLRVLLRIAARAGDAEFVQAMLDIGIPVDSADINGYTPLLWASYFGREEVTEILLNAGANVNHQNNYNDSALLLVSVVYQSMAVINLLLNNSANPDIGNNQGYTPLMMAARTGNEEILNTLIEADADVNLKNYLGNTALILAGQSGSTEAIHTLLDNGAVLNETNNGGFTAFMWAARFGQVEAVKTFLDVGLEIDDQNDFGDTALMWASLGGHKDVVDLLINRGADVDITTNDNFTALMGATLQGEAKVVATLIDAGADKYQSSSNGFTALTLAIASSDPEIVKILVDPTAISQQNQDGSTPLHVVVLNNLTSILLVLLESCPDYTIKDSDNRTAIELAEFIGNDTVINMLNGYIHAYCSRFGRQFPVGKVTYQNCEKLVCHCNGRWRLVDGYDPNCGGGLGKFLVRQRVR